MKTFAKLTVVAIAAATLVGCTGTIQQTKTCSTDYVLVPALSIPAIIGACDGK